MRPEPDPFDGRFDREAYLANRIALLAKALMDHTAWKRALDGAVAGASLAVAWVDGEGHRHIAAVDQGYLRIHLGIVRSLMADLDACGEVGNRALRGLFARQLAMDDEGEAG
jgi:hypothetical protein